MADMSRCDACPECRDRQIAAPNGVVTENRAGFTLAYRCPACGHSWVTSWAR